MPAFLYAALLKPDILSVFSWRIAVKQNDAKKAVFQPMCHFS